MQKKHKIRASKKAIIVTIISIALVVSSSAMYFLSDELFSKEAFAGLIFGPDQTEEDDDNIPEEAHEDNQESEIGESAFWTGESSNSGSDIGEENPYIPEAVGKQAGWCVGDFDFDGDVDLSDFSYFAVAFGTSPEYEQWIDICDLDRDADIDMDDFRIFKQFFRTCIICDDCAVCDADFNGDGRVNLNDFAIFAVAFGTSEGNANWNSNCDLFESGKIDMNDFRIFNLFFGRTCIYKQ